MKQLVVHLILARDEVARVIIRPVLVYVVNLASPRESLTDGPFDDQDVLGDWTYRPALGGTRPTKDRNYDVPLRVDVWPPARSSSRRVAEYEAQRLTASPFLGGG